MPSRRRAGAGNASGITPRRIWVTFRRALAVVPVVGLLGGVPFVQGADDLSVYPTAGTRTASPTSQISFRGGQPVAPTIHVEGSSSGAHTGKV